MVSINCIKLCSHLIKSWSCCAMVDMVSVDDMPKTKTRNP